MIDTDKYERTTPELEEFEGENLGDLITNLLAEVERLREEVEQMRVLKIVKENERLREENQTLRKMDWEYECLWDWLAENTNLLNTIEPLMEEWKKEMIE
jgi:regulator of replication initiation timing